jgi:acetyl esterase/lipase
MIRCVPVTTTRYNGMIHDFVLLNAIHELPETQSALRQSSDAIRSALSR